MKTIKIMIDQQVYEVEDGLSVLEAALNNEIFIPHLCFLKEENPITSCLMCYVEVKGEPEPILSCSKKIYDGMEIITHTDNLLKRRKTALSLLMSEHQGDCEALCQLSCPFDIDIPLLLRSILNENFKEARQTLLSRLPLTSFTHQLCPKTCEKACRRRKLDKSINIHQLENGVIQSSPESSLPLLQSFPTNLFVLQGLSLLHLSLSHFLLLHGQSVEIIKEKNDYNSLCSHLFNEQATYKNLENEIETLQHRGLVIHKSGDSSSLDMKKQYYLVKSHSKLNRVACYTYNGGQLKNQLDIPLPPNHSLKNTSMKSFLEIKNGYYLSKTIFKALFNFSPYETRAYQSKMKNLKPEELQEMSKFQNSPNLSIDINNTRNIPLWSEAKRCLHCDCRRKDDCKLKEYAEKYKVKQSSFDGLRRPLKQYVLEQIIYEPAKCINCGKCHFISEKYNIPFGLSFQSRGFNMKPQIPFNEFSHPQLKNFTQLWIAHCPTGAIAKR